MHAEVISIGDELTSGQRVDTNSAWISRHLAEIGVETRFHSTAGDDLKACAEVFRKAAERANVVVSTGGLGPTADDLTREAIALAAGVNLVLDPASLDHIKRLFASRGRTMPERNRNQAMFPIGAQPIPNPQGTAPGVAMPIARSGQLPCQIFALPGVPAEMFEMWKATVQPAIEALAPAARRMVERRIKCFGVGESHLEAMLPDLIRRGRQPRVGITVHQATITLRISAAGDTRAECLAAMGPTIQTIRDSLGTLVFGEEDDELEHAVLRQLAIRQATLATAEWGTAGLLAHWLGQAQASALSTSEAAPGPAAELAAQRGYAGGLVLHAADSLCNGASISTAANKYGPSSGEVAVALARRCQAQFGVDLALGVAGLPNVQGAIGLPGEFGSAVNPKEGPTPGEPRFAMAIADASGVSVESLPYGGHPEIRLPRAAKQALNLLRLKLLGES